MKIIEDEKKAEKKEIKFLLNQEDIKAMDKYKNTNVSRFTFIVINYIEEKIFYNLFEEVEFLFENVKKEKLKNFENQIEHYYHPIKYLNTKEILEGNRKIKRMYNPEGIENIKRF